MSDLDELVGLWDSRPFEYGSMEASRLALRPDGSGWGVWENAAGGMELTMLAWRRMDTDSFTIAETQLISGRWKAERPGCIVCDEPSVFLHDSTQFRYELIREIPPLLDGPVLALKLDQPFQFTHVYALVRRDVTQVAIPRIVGRDA
jgi:hypothetical protein